VTAAGRWASFVEGKTASATPAALATGSGPPIRVVLLVAKAGKASASATCGEGASSLLPPLDAGAEVVTSPSPPLSSSLPLAKTIATTMKARARTTRPASSFGVCDLGLLRLWRGLLLRARLRLLARGHVAVDRTLGNHRLQGTERVPPEGVQFPKTG
jgi:hypothetical protein